MSNKLELFNAVSVIAYCLVEFLLGKTKQGSFIGVAGTGLLSLLKLAINTDKFKSISQPKEAKAS